MINDHEVKRLIGVVTQWNRMAVHLTSRDIFIQFARETQAAFEVSETNSNHLI
jgi:hypothetical protein